MITRNRMAPVTNVPLLTDALSAAGARSVRAPRPVVSAPVDATTIEVGGWSASSAGSETSSSVAITASLPPLPDESLPDRDLCRRRGVIM
jgi:hypothetical protein